MSNGVGKTFYPRALVVLLVLLVVAFGAAPGHAASPEWQLSTSKDGVELYLRATAGSEFPRMRATGTVCASIELLTDHLQDAARFHEWIPDTVRAAMLSEPSASERIFYLVTEMPWPLKDRDMVYRLVRSGNTAASGEITIGMDGVPDYIPPIVELVRIQSVEGSWHFVEQDGRTRIELEMHMEPGGNIKPWLANRRIGAMVAGMLANLRRIYEPSCHAQVGEVLEQGRIHADMVRHGTEVHPSLYLLSRPIEAWFLRIEPRT